MTDVIEKGARAGWLSRLFARPPVSPQTPAKLPLIKDILEEMRRGPAQK